MSGAKTDRLIVEVPGEAPLLFSSAAAAEGYLEGIDVRNGEYPSAYAIDGTPMMLIDDGHDKVAVMRSDASPDETSVRKLLEDGLRRAGIQYSDNMSIEALFSLLPNIC